MLSIQVMAIDETQQIYEIMEQWIQVPKEHIWAIQGNRMIGRNCRVEDLELQIPVRIRVRGCGGMVPAKGGRSPKKRRDEYDWRTGSQTAETQSNVEYKDIGK